MTMPIDDFKQCLMKFETAVLNQNPNQISLFNQLIEMFKSNISSGWISVNELPQPFKSVLVLNNAGKVGIGFVDGTGWWLSNTTGGFSTYQANSDFFDVDLMNVAFWQPLPNPPTE